MLTSTRLPDEQVGPAREETFADHPPVTSRSAVTVVVRRRRVVGALAVLALLFGVVATVAHVPAAWAPAGLAAALTVGYLAAVTRMRGLAVEREMTLAFGPGSAQDEVAWENVDPVIDSHAEPVLVATAERGAVATFVLASLLGWLLMPVVAAIRLARGDLSDLRSRGVLDRLVRAQAYGRSQSLKVLTVSVAATAGVTGVGMTAGASMAGATPVAATAKLSVTAAATSAGPSSYTVRPGDTLSAIAQQYGPGVPALVAANGITNPDHILAGQVLVVHLPPYTVGSGDTLSAIAVRFGRSVEALAATNAITNPNVITIGQTLHVGGGNLPAAAQPVAPTPRMAKASA
ncbi:MAG: LysM peptidoglycan-binding domain-containing protein, partial [Actinomycetota bacterium]|nr:LysM peptidoglycan-binding domain-containing protein [Actinomycetota bacterium]